MEQIELHKEQEAEQLKNEDLCDVSTPFQDIQENAAAPFDQEKIDA